MHKEKVGVSVIFILSKFEVKESVQSIHLLLLVFDGNDYYTSHIKQPLIYKFFLFVMILKSPPLLLSSSLFSLKKKEAMEKTLIDYDKNLQELERQREQLEIVMQKMGQEWEER